MALEPFEWKPSTSQQSHNFDLNELCSSWIANNISHNSINSASPTQSSSQAQRPSHFLVWSVGLSFVTIISLCALVGILFMRFLKKKTFNTFITFFVSVGAIFSWLSQVVFYARSIIEKANDGFRFSGSAVFHLLPQAFGLVVENSSTFSNTNHDYLSKALAAVVGIYLFFFSDKLIKIVLETRKRNRNEPTELPQLNPPLIKREKENAADGHSHAHFDCSSDALISSQTKGIQAKEGDKLDRVIPDEIHEASYNRQAHSICVHDHDMKYNEGDSVIATVAWMIIFGDGLHNLIDGISIGASFSESILSGISVSVAVLCEEFPHELGDVAILVSAGMTLRQALVYNLLSALSCYIGFVIGVVVGNVDESFAAYTFGFAGGMFLYISMSCMMPEMKNAMEEALSISLARGLEVLTLQAIGVSVGLIVMACMANYGGQIQFQT